MNETKRPSVRSEGFRMSPLFEIVCQNFETSLDSMLGLHEDIKIGNIEQNALQQIFTPWKEFVDSLPKPRLAPQAPSASTKSSWGRSHDKENEDKSPFTRCLLWYKSSHKFVLLASNCPSLCHEDCLLLKDHIQFLLQPRVPSRSLPHAAALAASCDAGPASDSDGTFVPFKSSVAGDATASPSISSALSTAESSSVAASAASIGSDHVNASASDTVYLGQIDDKSGTFLAGQDKFRLFQNLFFEDSDGVLVLQSLRECTPADALPVAPVAASAQNLSSESGAQLSESKKDNDAALFAAVETFKGKLTKSFKSNPWSMLVHHDMNRYIRDYPGLVQFLCVNR